MKKLLLFIVFLLAVSILSYAIDHHRWPIKTIPARKTKPRTLQLKDVIALADPPDVKMNDKRYEEKRIPAFPNELNLKEGDLIKVEGYFHLVAFEDNDDEYHIQISDNKESGDNCLIVEVPDPKDVDDESLKIKYENVRTFIREKILNGKNPSRAGNVVEGRAYVSVTGQLFFDASHTHNQPKRGKKGMKTNSLWEIHPIIDMRFAPKP